MEATVLPLVILVVGCHGRLNSDPQELEGYNYPVQRSSDPTPSASSLVPSGILGNPYNNPLYNEAVTEIPEKYSTQGNLRKVFSFEAIKNPRGKVRYEALKSNVNDQQEPDDKYGTENSKEKKLSPKQRDITEGNRFYSTTTTKSKYALDESGTKRTITGPNVDGQQPYRHWSTESNIIREEHPDGLSSYPYITPTGSRQEAYSGRNLHRLSSTEGYAASKKSPKQLYGNTDLRDAIIPATTYRPSTTTDHGYTFSFKSKNHSRHETGDMKGNFRGSIKYVNTYGGGKQIDYEGNPEIGIVASDSIPVVNIPGSSGHRYVPTSTSLPSSTSRSGLTYSFRSPGTATSYIPTTSRNKPSLFTTTPRPEFVDRGNTAYQPPQLYIQPVQTYLTDSTGDPYDYYMETPQYVILPPDFGSYMFTYNAGDHQRTERRDKDGNVEGMYSFEGTDGQRKQVTYEANSEKGFVARGSHLPVQPEDLPRSQDPYQESTLSQGNEESPSDGAYFFSYNAGEHMRQERKDGLGNIHGMYSYLTGDGQRKTVKYRANPSEGFVATGDDIPNTQDSSYVVNYHIGQQQGYSPESSIQNVHQHAISIR